MSARNLLILTFTCALTISVNSAAQAARSAADQRLYEEARKACSGPKYPNGARPHINYAGGWFRCVRPKSSDR